MGEKSIKDSSQPSAEDSGQPSAPPFQFQDVYKAEWGDIYDRRKQLVAHGFAPCPADQAVPPPNLVGLAFSGGGIRSATICLGVLQELDRLKLLPIFDYLSTVSGGGYVGGWWSAWLSRKRVLAKLTAEHVSNLPPGSVPKIFDNLQLTYDSEGE